ncbi:MAG: hypothetical protein SFW62_03615 [Alphaproteobacteria bacterium]|nr:hypothetical protein [Alphaproteobacteria bacterium]
MSEETQTPASTKVQKWSIPIRRHASLAASLLACVVVSDMVSTNGNWIRIQKTNLETKAAAAIDQGDCLLTTAEGTVIDNKIPDALHLLPTIEETMKFHFQELRPSVIPAGQGTQELETKKVVYVLQGLNPETGDVMVETEYASPACSRRLQVTLQKPSTEKLALQ